MHWVQKVFIVRSFSFLVVSFAIFCFLSSQAAARHNLMNPCESLSQGRSNKYHMAYRQRDSEEKERKKEKAAMSKAPGSKVIKVYLSRNERRMLLSYTCCCCCWCFFFFSVFSTPATGSIFTWTQAQVAQLRHPLPDEYLSQGKSCPN